MVFVCKINNEIGIYENLNSLNSNNNLFSVI